MLHRIVMNVISVALIIRLIAKDMFPISILPDGPGSGQRSITRHLPTCMRTRVYTPIRDIRRSG